MVSNWREKWSILMFVWHKQCQCEISKKKKSYPKRRNWMTQCSHSISFKKIDLNQNNGGVMPRIYSQYFLYRFLIKLWSSNMTFIFVNISQLRLTFFHVYGLSDCWFEPLNSDAKTPHFWYKYSEIQIKSTDWPLNNANAVKKLGRTKKKENDPLYFSLN